MTHGAADGFRGNQYTKEVRSNSNLSKKGGKNGEKIAKEFGVGYGTVLRAENFVDGLNEADKVSPGIKEAVLSKIAFIGYLFGALKRLK